MLAKNTNPPVLKLGIFSADQPKKEFILLPLLDLQLFRTTKSLKNKLYELV